MITPNFQIEQSESTATIKVSAPFSEVKELEVHVDKAEFIFSCKPYFLRLQLPGEIKEGFADKIVHEASGEFVFTYQKATVGQDFLRQPAKVKVYESDNWETAVDQVLHANDLQEIKNDQGDNLEGDDQGDDQEGGVQYGFALIGNQNLKPIFSEVQELFEINPFEVEFKDRCSVRHEKENKQFSIDHYIADLMDNVAITDITDAESPWSSLQSRDVAFEEEELDLIDSLPTNNYQLSDMQVKYCENSLLDILYAYCYDRRTTDFEGTVESGWTITKISATLSCFDSFETPKQALSSAFRRSLIYPLYRGFGLCKKVLEDLKRLLALGDKFVIKCLLDIYNIMEDCSERYIFNDLYVRDYIVYVKNWGLEVLPRLLNDINNVNVEKSDLELNLLEIEEDCMVQNMTQLNLNESSSDSEETDTSDSGSETNSESSDDTLT